MKQTLIALSILGFTCVGAQAQTKTVTTTTTTVKKEAVKTDTPNYAKNYKVCKGNATYYVCGDKPGTAKKTRKTTTVQTEKTAAVTTGGTASDNAKNYKVCQGNSDYHICDQPKTPQNTVKTGKAKRIPVATANKATIKTTTVTENGVVATTTNQTFASQPVVAPQPQSVQATAPAPAGIVADNTLSSVTITGKVDTITNANAPYHGKNSPQYDGVEKNKARNLNTPPQSPNATFR